MAEFTTKELAQGIALAKEEAKEFLGKLNESFDTIKETAAFISKQKGGLNLGDAKDLETFNSLYSETISLVEKKVKIDASIIKTKANLAKIDKEEIKLLQESEKLKQAEIKTIKDTEKNRQELLKTQLLQNKATKEENKQEQDLSKVKKKAIDLTDDEIKQQIILRKATAQRKKDLEAELILEAKSIKNKQDLTDRIKALRIEGAQLDLGSEELKENIAEIDKLVEKLSDSSDQFIKNKINIGNYKSATEGLTLSFEDQKKKLAILEETYKDFRLSGAKATKESKDLKDALDDQKKTLEGLKDASEDTGKAVKGLGTAFKALSIGLIIAAIAKIGEFFGSSREASLESSKQIAIFTESLKVLFANAVKAFGGIKVAFNSAVNSISKGIIAIQIGFQNIELSRVKAFDLNPLADYSKEISVIEAKIASLKTESAELAKETGTVAEGWDMVTGAFEKTGGVITDSIKSQQVFLQLQQDSIIEIERQTRALAGLQEKRKILQDISDDDTLGFITRAIAIKKAEDAANDFAKKEVTLAKVKEKLTIEAIKQQLINEGVSVKGIQTGEKLNSVLNQRISSLRALRKGEEDVLIARKISDVNETAFTEAFAERVEKETEIRSFQRDAEEKFRKTNRDGYEQRNDIITESAELLFATNETIIADEQESFDTRRKALEANERDSRQLITDTFKITKEQAAESLRIQRSKIDLNATLSPTEKELAKVEIDKNIAKLEGLEVDKLVNISNNQKLFDTIRAIDLGEIEEKVIKDSLKIRKEQIEVNKTASKELNQSQKDALELQKDIDAQQKVLDTAKLEDADQFNEAIKQLDEERFANKVDLLRREIELLDDGSKEELEKKKELNDLLISEEERKTAADKEESDKRKKEQEETSKFLKDSFFNTAKSFFQSRAEMSKAREQEINADIQGAQTRNAELLALSESGNSQVSQLAADSLAAQRAIEREKTQELEKEKKKQIRLELILSGLEIVKNNAGQPNAVGKTLAEVGALIAGLSSFGGSFFKGTDKLGSQGKGIDSKGGIPIVAHPNEMIIQKDLNQKMGFPDRHDVADVFTRYKNGDLLDKGIATSATIQQISVNTDNSEVVNALNSVKKELRNQNNAQVMLDISKNQMYVKERKGNRINKYIN